MMLLMESTMFRKLSTRKCGRSLTVFPKITDFSFQQRPLQWNVYQVCNKLIQPLSALEAGSYEAQY